MFGLPNWQSFEVRALAEASNGATLEVRPVFEPSNPASRNVGTAFGASTRPTLALMTNVGRGKCTSQTVRTRHGPAQRWLLEVHAAFEGGARRSNYVRMRFINGSACSSAGRPRSA